MIQGLFKTTAWFKLRLLRMNTGGFAETGGSRMGAAGKTAQTLALFVVLTIIPYVVPSLRRYRVFLPAGFRPARSGDHIEDAGGLAVLAQPAPLGEVLDPARASIPASGGQINPTPGQIEDPSGHALDHFFDALGKAEAGQRVARVCHYGDSPITNDGITSTVRSQLQLRFGDAGHGFILIDKPWGWYEHAGVMRDASRGWASDPMFIARGDHLYGLGGVSFTSEHDGTSATFGTATEGQVGRQVSSFDIYYLAQPGGGDFDIEVDGSPVRRVSTARDVVVSGFAGVQVPAGPHKLNVSASGNGEVRLFGVVLESGRGGVQYDSLGVNGAFVGLLANYMDGEHWAEQLRHRNPDLVILNYGTNESQFERLPMDQYQRDTVEVIRRIRSALPGASIMLVAPMDRGARGEGGRIVTRPTIPRLVSYQRAIAAQTGCAFFDTYTAMGGEGTVARWCDARPKLMGGDYTHPTAKGAEIVGNLIYNAIIGAYDGYRSEHVPTQQAVQLNSGR
jgi:lysophospholipase L1-like esterase